MKTQIVDINQVKVNPDNPRTIKDEKFNQLVDSVNGFSKMLSLRPIVVDDNMMILGGNMRYEACVAAGFKKVTVIVASELTEEEKKEFIIKDNISGGEWDLQKLEDQYEFSVLADWGIDLEIPDMEEDETYTDKIDSVTYEPKGDKPELSDMLNEDKSNELKKRIKKSGLPDDEKEFLLSAADRHKKFNYKNIAEYYSHSGKEMQALMEELALVIIDYDKAIDLGYVELRDDVSKQYEKSYGSEDCDG